MARRRMSKRASRAKFGATSGNTRAVNIDARVMRGGFRL